jgi:hypothetical protein
MAGSQERWEPGSACRISLSGVDQSILAAILTLESRGRRCKIWWGHYDQAAGTIIADPLMNDTFDITESHDPATGAGTVDIATRISERVSDVGRLRGIRTNVQSHQASGIPGASTDTFFHNVAGLLGTRIFCATEAPLVPQAPYVPPPPPGGPGSGYGFGGTRPSPAASPSPGSFGVPPPTTGGAGFGHDPTGKQG